MTRRLRLLAGLALAALAGWWAAHAARDAREWTQTLDAAAGALSGAVARSLAPVKPAERCPDCWHLGREHDPDLGCTAYADPWTGGDGPCPCRRPGCECPGKLPPGDRR